MRYDIIISHGISFPSKQHFVYFLGVITPEMLHFIPLVSDIIIFFLWDLKNTPIEGNGNKKFSITLEKFFGLFMDGSKKKSFIVNLNEQKDKFSQKMLSSR